MTRRRLILAACVAVVALGAAWWLTADGLTVEERRLVGTWHLASGPGKWTFGANRTGGYERLVSTRGWNASTNTPVGTVSLNYDFPQVWAVRGGVIIIDFEMSNFRRTLRPVLRLLGPARVEPQTFTLESVTETEMVVVAPDGTRETWTRERGD